jgi:20S proteasome subunit alpha 5
LVPQQSEYVSQQPGVPHKSKTNARIK